MADYAVNRRITLLPLLASAALTVAACGGSTPGTASPTSSATSTTSGSSTGSSDAANKLLQTDPCSLLSSSVLSQYGLGAGKSSNDAGARSCGWQKPTDNNGNGYTLGVDIWDSLGIKDIDPSSNTITDDPINGRPAKQTQDKVGDVCAVVLGVTDSSRVDVQVNESNSDMSQACQEANQFAKIIGPELPGGNG